MEAVEGLIDAMSKVKLDAWVVKRVTGALRHQTGRHD